MRAQTVEANPHLALVGMHGLPERTGLALLESCQENPIAGWDVEVANEAAVAAGVRYVEHNLAWAFGPDLFDRANDDVYELRRPSELCDMVQGRKTVLEVHDRPDDVGEYVAIGGAYCARLLGVAALMGVRSVVSQVRFPTLSNYSCTNLVVELCRDDEGDSAARVADNVVRLRSVMEAISANTVPAVDERDFDYYDYVREIHGDEARTLGLEQDASIQAFSPIPEHIIRRLGLPIEKQRYVAEYWNGVGSAQGEWFGGVMRQIPPPKQLRGRPTERAELRDIEVVYARAS